MSYGGCSDYIVSPKMQIFASAPADDISIENAKRFTRLNGLDGDDVKIIKTDKVVCVETIREVEIII